MYVRQLSSPGPSALTTRVPLWSYWSAPTAIVTLAPAAQRQLSACSHLAKDRYRQTGRKTAFTLPLPAPRNEQSNAYWGKETIPCSCLGPFIARAWVKLSLSRLGSYAAPARLGVDRQYASFAQILRLPRCMEYFLTFVLCTWFVLQ